LGCIKHLNLSFMQSEDTSAFSESKMSPIRGQFNQLTTVWPKNLKYLNIESGSFQKPLINLPNTLEKLEINFLVDYRENQDRFFKLKYEEPLRNLPESLKILILRNYGGNLDKLPDQLHTLHLYEYEEKITKLPDSLKMFRIEPDFADISELPDGLEILKLFVNLDEPLEVLPSNLKVLKTYGENIILDNLPQNLEKLAIMGYNNGSLDNLPNSLISLNLLNLQSDNEFNFDFLPMNLKVLYLPSDCNKNKFDNLPSSIEELYIGKYFNDMLNNLPPNLKKLHFTPKNRMTFPIQHLPKSLETISISKSYPHLDQLREIFKGEIIIVY